ncbi:hypothetical protein NE237_022810 [Protea cynaroides]|uniref:Uncharacterized protein n=1 Tax=Protea cynaroides TaxID=273540 RepID=A0A9Q0HAB9_9MAGN|nr:hypothetical protein NE237_022810 [Protea cynaroides]
MENAIQRFYALENERNEAVRKYKQQTQVVNRLGEELKLAKDTIEAMKKKAEEEKRKSEEKDAVIDQEKLKADKALDAKSSLEVKVSVLEKDKNKLGEELREVKESFLRRVG